MRDALFSEGKEFKLHRLCMPLFKETERLAKESLKPTTAMSFSKFENFYQTGKRDSYEKEYFEKRGRLNFFALTVLCGYNEYITPLEDIIWAICDEFTWALPAHIPSDTEMNAYPSFLDLFASETSFAISEIYYLLKDVLSDKIKKRMEYEIRRRVIEPYLKHNVTYWWETSTNNWSAVCAGSIGAAFLYMASEEEEKQARVRILDTLSYYLSGFGNDGVCTEGYTYWLYGFGFFTAYASLLRQYTDADADLFKNEKVRNIAAFQSEVAMGDGICANFSDGIERFRHRVGLSCFLHREYDEITVPGIKSCIMPGDDHCYRWCTFIRDFVWTDDSAAGDVKIKKGTVFLPDAQWFIHKCARYSFAAKAGGNGESHNHNDVGSFIVAADNSSIISELGCGEYTKGYFLDESRYTYLVNSSRGHSLPIINGEYQKAGKQYCGKIISHDEESFTAQISGAYDKGTVKSLVRNFKCLDSCVLLTDTFELEAAAQSVVERLICTSKPTVSGNEVYINGCTVKFNNEEFICEVSSEIFSGHDTLPRTAYFVDFKAKNPSQRLCFAISILI